MIDNLSFFLGFIVGCLLIIVVIVGCVPSKGRGNEQTGGV